MQLIKDTFLFEYFDKATDLRGKMLQYSPVLDNLDKKLMEDDLHTIAKRYNYPMKNRVIADIEAGRIVPVLNKERVKLPSSMPSYLYNDQGKVVAIVNFTNYVSKTVEDKLHGDTRQMFACLQTGSVLLGCFEKWNQIVSNQDVNKLGALMYAKMFVKVLDKMFAVNLDNIKADKLKFIAARFYVQKLLGKPWNETALNTCLTVCSHTTRNTIINFNNELNDKDFTKLDKLIEMIAMRIDGCSGLSIRAFLDTYMRMFGTSTLFALEYLPMFFHAIFSVAVGAHLNSEFMIESLMGKDIDKLYNVVSNIIR